MNQAAHITVSHPSPLQGRGRTMRCEGVEFRWCRAQEGCSQMAVRVDGLISCLAASLSTGGMGRLMRLHRRFRVAVAGCPNGCSRPHIVDIGIIAAVYPERLDSRSCSGCGLCVDACLEHGIEAGQEGPRFDFERCLGCGHCIATCQAGSIGTGAVGYRILIGGKLGRHPRLATEIGFFPEEKAVAAVEGAIRIFATEARPGERFGTMLERIGMARIMEILMEQVNQQTKKEA